MDLADLRGALDPERTGEEMYELISQLYPICRSITGDGLRESLRLIQKHVPLNVHEVPSGTRVFDWTVPEEWNISDAYVKNLKGERVIDFRKSTLHVVSYSEPVRRRMLLEDLKTHLFTLPEHPEWIPYRTSYYERSWGFCLSHEELLGLEEGEYEVCIDSRLEQGHLTYGECVLAGEGPDEVLISCHACHPSLCNDNLSGVALVAFLAKHLSRVSLRYSYRFLFIPGTIGSITWLRLNESQVSSIKHGLTVANVGDPGRSTYKKSRCGDAEIDRATAHVLKHSGGDYTILPFSPYGYDERQFSSPGFDLPVGCLMRTPPGGFPQYHTSADNLEFVRPSCLADSFFKCLAILDVLEHNRAYRNLNAKCEPQLGRRGLYRSVGGPAGNDAELALLWVLNLSDGRHSLLDIADRAGLPFERIQKAADALLDHHLLADQGEEASCREREAAVEEA